MEHARGVCRGGILAKAPFSAVVPFSWNTILLLKCTPLFFFSVRGEKEERRARWRRKRGLLGADLGVAVFLPLLRGWLECCAKSAETLVHCSSGRAPRWCGDWEVCGTERVFCCGSFASMCKDALWKGCFAVLLFALLLAQCALWVRSGKSSILLNRDEHFAFLQRTTPLQQPSAPGGAGARGAPHP